MLKMSLERRVGLVKLVLFKFCCFKLVFGEFFVDFGFIIYFFIRIFVDEI